ncbi:MAG: energy transducer TonB [Pyrinomonadaceae bacterium]
MSSVGSDDQFFSDDELKRVLEHWTAPEASKALDQRVINSYYRELGSEHAAIEPVALHPRQKEVVNMKSCSTCQEAFADKFSFCPVDGTPLNGSVPKDEESTVSAVRIEPAVRNEPVIHTAAVSPSGVIATRGEYHLTIMDDKGLVLRLADELKGVAHEYELTWPEFKRDPFGFTKRSILGYGQMAGRFFGNRNVLIATGAGVLAMAALVGVATIMDRTNSVAVSRTALILFGVVAVGMLVATFATWFGRDQGAAVAGAQPSDSRHVVVAMMVAFVFIFGVVGSYILLEALAKRQQDTLAQNAEELQVDQLIDIPAEQPTPDPGTAGLNKGSGGGSKPKQEKAGGGGGGGREEQKPASFGKTPQASLTVPQVVAPDPKPPAIKNPSLPVAATVVADRLLVPPDARVLPYGDFKSKSTDPSSGPGTGNGIGTGRGGGIGPGEGGGIGPGRGGNIGGGDRNDGGGGAGGGGGGTDYNRVFSGKEVSSKARVLSKPEPQYTEEARKNQITGTVVLRAIFTSSGQVTQIRAVSGLPYGLTERAIAAARQIRFTPATKDGRAVSMYIQLEYNFNLY